MKIKIVTLLMVVIIFIGTSTSCNKSLDLEKPISTEIEDQPYVIHIENLSLGNTYEDIAAVEDAVNQIIEPKINCHIKIVNYHIADHINKVALAIAGVDKLDLINTGLTTNLSSHVSDGVVIPLEDLIDEYAPNLYEKVKQIIQGTSMNQHIYAIPANLYPSKSIGLGFNKALLDRYSLTIPETINLETLTALGAKLKASGEEVYLMDNANGSLSIFDVFYFSETFDVTFSQGVIINPLVNTKIINVYESLMYEEYCKTLKTWYDHGYLPANSISAGLTGQQTFNSGVVLMQMMNVSPLGEQIALKKGLPFEEVLVPVNPNVVSQSSVQEYAWGITSSCERPEKVMEFLELLYNDTELTNLMTHGIEGKNYVKVSENVVKYPEGVTGDNVGYSRIFSMYGDMLQQYQFYPATENFYDEAKAFYSESKPLLTFGYSFDTAAVTSEIAAVNEIVTEFRPILESGVLDDVEEALRIFNEELKKAGIERVIAENQRQLDAWLSLNHE